MIKILLILCCLLSLTVRADDAPVHCDAEKQTFCYAAYMIHNVKLMPYEPTVVDTIASYCAPRAAMDFAVSRFSALNDSTVPDYALGDILMRPSSMMARLMAMMDSRYAFYTHAVVIQICDVDGARCRYDAAYSARTDAVVPGTVRSTTSANINGTLPPLSSAYFFSHSRKGCPSNDSASYRSLMLPDECVVFASSAAAFRVCDAGALVASLRNASCVVQGSARFCPVAMAPGTEPDATLVTRTAPSEMVTEGLYFSSHPLLPLTSITMLGGATSDAAVQQPWF